MTPSNSNRIWFVVSTLLTVTLYVASLPPQLSYPFIWLSTFAHEMGHGLASLLIGGDFDSFQMWSDGSGIAQTAGHTSRLGSAFVSAGGLVGPAVAALFCFFFARSERRARAGCYLFGVLGVLATVLVVRNLFGIAFLLTLSLFTLTLAHRAPAWLTQGWVTLLGVQLALSVFSRGDYLFTDKAITSGGTLPSDTAQMANALLLPYWFWGGVCGGFSVFVLAIGLKLIWKPIAPQVLAELPPQP